MRLAAKEHWGPALLLRRMARGPLAELAAGGVDVRGELRAAVRRLPGPLRADAAGLARLGGGPLSVQDAAAALGREEAAAEDVLEALVDENVLSPSGMAPGGRFSYVLAAPLRWALLEEPAGGWARTGPPPGRAGRVSAPGRG